MRVYCITFPNGKKYVGVESKFHRRFSDHKKARSKQLVHSAIRKYKWENCRFEYLTESIQNEDAWSLEKKLIQEWNLKDPNKGYNLTDGGDTSIGYHHIDETKEKIRKKAIGRTASEDARRKMALFRLGRKQKKETVDKRAEKLRGQKRTDEVKKKFSIQRKGRKLTEEHRKKLGVASHLRGQTEATKEKLSKMRKGEKNPFYGKIHSIEFKEKISKVHSGNTYRRKVVVELDAHNKKLIREYPSSVQAAMDIGITRFALYHLMRDQKEYKGSVFQYKQETIFASRIK